MPGAIHEALVLMFQSNPGLAALLLGDVLGFELPAYSEVQEGSSSFSEMKPPEYRADSVAVLKQEDGKAVLSVIVEVQLSVNERKRADWLAYTASMTRQQGCPSCVLVVTPDAKIARWAAEPFSFGLNCTYTPMVIGPGQMPLIVDSEEAKKRPYLAVLSAVAHGRDSVERAVEVANAARDGLVPLEDRALYFDLIKASLSEAARKAFEMIPATYEFQDESLRNSLHKGRAQGRAESVLDVLEARDIAVSKDERTQILACEDREQLKRMVQKAAVAQSVSELFD